MKIKNNIIIKSIEKNKLDTFIMFSFFFFIGFYLLNIDTFEHLISTDFKQRYKPNGILLVDQIISLDFKNINFLNFYFIPELITGILLKIFSNHVYFYIANDLLNMILLFLSFKFFFKSLNIINNYIFFIFLIIFFLYVPNWIWTFWKLADVYFLFIFSLIFYFLSKGISQSKLIYVAYALCLCFLTLITKPQGLVAIPFFVLSIFLLKYYKNNFFLIILILFLLYLLFFPLLVFIMTKMNYENYITKVFADGRISFNILYSYNIFIDKFDFPRNDISQLFYYYYLVIKKLIFQLTFIRETYSFRHNVILIPYIIAIYFFLIINLEYLIKEYDLFFKLTTLITFFAVLLYCSTFTGSEPNRFQLFHLVPLYILVSISFDRFLKQYIDIVR